MVTGFTDNLDTHIANAKKAGTTKKTELMKIAQEYYASHEATLESAKAKAASFSGIPESTINSWIETARRELSSVYSTIEKQFQAPAIKKVPAKKPVAKTTTKKPVAKKTPTPKTPSV
jgi:glycerate-2-kinase